MEEDKVKKIKKTGETVETIKNEMGKIIIGQKEIIEDLIITLLCKGHCLLVGVPGLAKTLMSKTLANIMDLTFKRIQFTPDLMPSDITGTEIIQDNPETGKREGVFVNGPVFANMVLADEINRTPPKTQAALLQAMEEREVTSGNVTHKLPDPFFVVATQNPIEQEGTYNLPEAQLDRFMFNLMLGYPEEAEEIQIVDATTMNKSTTLKKVITAGEILELQSIIKEIPVAKEILAAAVQIVRNTRPDFDTAPEYIKNWVDWGAGPRASQYLITASKARAIIKGRFNVSIRDIKHCVFPVLRHRIITNFAAESENIKSDDIIKRLIEKL